LVGFAISTFIVIPVYLAEIVEDRLYILTFIDNYKLYYFKPNK